MLATMRQIRLRRRPPSPAFLRREGVVALLLLLAAFGLYGTTTGQLVGYEPQNAAIAEGLVKTGQLRVMAITPLSNNAAPGARQYSITGLTQPLLESPFYLVGEKLDDAASGGRSYKWRLALLRLYNPAMAALTVLAIFLLLRLHGRSMRRSLGVAALCATASLIWPYSKIGMETTLMAMVALMLLSISWASAKGGADRYALAGFAAGAVAASKPIGIVLLVGLLAFAGPVVAMPRRERIRTLGALAVPVLVWFAAIAWYNVYRTGSITNFNNGYAADPLGAPVAAIGLLISPGKGLFLYSPLVILGILGMRSLAGADRQLAMAILLIAGANVLAISGTAQWSDDTWGPRYVVASAWLLMLPIAWWAEGRVRRRVLAAAAALAVVVQMAGVFSWYGLSVSAARTFSGDPVYLYGGFPQTAVAYGNDGPTWIPGVSDLRFKIDLLAAWIKEHITGTGFKVSYAPFWGHPGTVDLTHPSQDLGVPLPDFWWNFPGQTTALDALGAALGVLTVAGTAALVRIFRSSTAALSHERSPARRASP